MNFKIDQAEQVYESELDLFSVKDVNTAVELTYLKEFNPISKPSHGAPIEFNITNSSPDYISLKETKLYIEVGLYNETGVMNEADANVGVINLPGASLFRQCDVSLQQQVLTANVGSNYPYKALFDSLFKYNWLEQNMGALPSAGFVKDQGLMDATNCTVADNAGLQKRYKATNGKTAFYVTKLFVDVFDQEKLLLNHVPLNVKLYPSNDKFALMYGKLGANKYYYFKIENAKLVVPFVKIQSSLLEEHGRELRKSMALYPFIKSDIKTFTVNAGSQEFSVDNVFQENIPDVMFVAMTGVDNYSGDNAKNPFNFEHNNLNHLDFSINGFSNESLTFKPSLKNNSLPESKNSYMQSYASLFKKSNPEFTDIPNIDLQEYVKGYFIHKLNVSRSTNSQYSTPLRKGQTRLTLRFAVALSKAITVIVYGTFNGILKIDESRNIDVQS